jgi:uncharacterized protein YjbI with pentapeptide repeats
MKHVALVALLMMSMSATAFAGEVRNGVKLNGVKLNGVKLNGVKLNGVKLNGVKLNGDRLGNGDAGAEGGLTVRNAAVRGGRLFVR